MSGSERLKRFDQDHDRRIIELALGKALSLFFEFGIFLVEPFDFLDARHDRRDLTFEFIILCFEIPGLIDAKCTDREAADQQSHRARHEIAPPSY